MPVAAAVAAAVALGTTIYKVNEDWKANNTLDHFLFGQNNDFQGSEFNKGSMAVRIYLKDPSLTFEDIKRFRKNWNKNWINYGGKKKDKWWRNRKAFIYKIYDLAKREYDFVLPPDPVFKTVAEARKVRGSAWDKYSDASVQDAVNKQLDKWVKAHLARRAKWLKAGRKDPLPGYLETNTNDLGEQTGNGEMLGHLINKKASLGSGTDLSNDLSTDTTTTQAGISLAPKIILGLLAAGTLFMYLKKKK